MARLGIAIAVVLLLATTAGAAPSVEEIVQRVLGLNTDTPSLASADAVFKLRVKKAIADPPDCEFNARMQFLRGHQTMRVAHRTGGPLCWAVDKYLLGGLYQASEPIESFLDRFDFRVLGEKLVGNDHYYLLQGAAKDPKNEPRSLLGWVDYERGLVTDGRLEYSWGGIDAEQRFVRVNGAWVLAHQLIQFSRFDATMEVFYSNFRFAP